MADEEQVKLGLGLGLGKKEGTGVMTPWEQHSAVINLPRFDYNAPSSLLHYSHTGFLITCPIKREKSATKEAITILAKYVGSLRRDRSHCLEAFDANSVLKKRKIYSKEENTENSHGAEKTDTNECGKISKETSSSSTKMGGNVEKGLLSLVKLTKSGLLLFTFPSDTCTDTTKIVSRIFHSVDSGNQKPLMWSHRIFPIQATCRLNDEDLGQVVSKLVQQFLENKWNKFQRPVKFAVGYNRRGMDEGEKSKSSALLDRNKCFELVGRVIKETIADSIVDLKSPEFAVFIELLPVSGIPTGSSVVAVSILPQDLIVTKPRLSIRALSSDTKPKN